VVPDLPGGEGRGVDAGIDEGMVTIAVRFHG